MADREIGPEAARWGVILFVALLIQAVGDLDGPTGVVVGIIGAAVGVAVGATTTSTKVVSPWKLMSRCRSLAAWFAFLVVFAVTFALTRGWWYRLLVFLPFGLCLVLLQRRDRQRCATSAEREPVAE